MAAERDSEVCIRRHRNSPEYYVIVTYRGREMSVRCRDYDQAVKWARLECKVYKLPEPPADADQSLHRSLADPRPSDPDWKSPSPHGFPP